MKTFPKNMGKREFRQKGFALITALIFLVVLTMLGLSVVASTTSEESVARNARDYDLALAAAEAALRDAELRLTGAWKVKYDDSVERVNFDTSCTAGLCDVTSPVPLAFQVDRLDFFAAGSTASTIGDGGTLSPAMVGVSAQPKYMIEMICDKNPAKSIVTGVACNTVFRITAQGAGRFSNTRVSIQELYIPINALN